MFADSPDREHCQPYRSPFLLVPTGARKCRVVTAVHNGNPLRLILRETKMLREDQRYGMNMSACPRLSLCTQKESSVVLGVVDQKPHSVQTGVLEAEHRAISL